MKVLSIPTQCPAAKCKNVGLDHSQSIFDEIYYGACVSTQLFRNLNIKIHNFNDLKDVSQGVGNYILCVLHTMMLL